MAQTGPRDDASVLAARYWLTEKGWAATEPPAEDGDE